MYHLSFHWLELILLSSSMMLLLAWLGSWLQRSPQRLQRWCEGGIAFSVLAGAIIFAPFPRPAMVDTGVRTQDSAPTQLIQAASMTIEARPKLDTGGNGATDASAIGAMGPAIPNQPMPSPIPWRQLLTWSYLAGAVLCVSFLLVGRLRLRWIESAARQFEDTSDVPSHVRLLVSPRAKRPFCYGIFDSRIVLPHAVAKSRHRQHILRHELVHLQRGDALTRALMNFTMPVLYGNPFYWLLRRSAILASEHVADIRAAEATSVDAYATGMIELARLLKSDRSTLSVVRGWTSPTALIHRVEWLLHGCFETSPYSRRWSCTSGGIAVSVLCVVMLLFGCTPETLRRSDIETIDDSIAGCIWSMTPELPGSSARISDCDVKTVSGQVIGDNGPVADAAVWASGYGRISGREKAVTDSEGRFQLALPIDPRMAIRSWHVAAFKGDQFGRSGNVSDDGQLTINLKKGRTIDIEVRDRSTDESIEAARLFLDDGRIVDAPDGRVRISGLPSNLYKLVVVAKGLARRAIQVDLHALDQDRLIVKLKRGGRIHGKVVDRGGRPVAGTPVGLGISSMSLQASMRQFTDDDGRYRLDGVPINEPTRVLAYSHQTPGGSNWETTTVMVPKDTSLEVNFTVDGDHAAPADAESPGIRALHSDRPDPERGAIRGRVLLPSGEPATEFELSFEWPRDWQPGEKIISGGPVGNACLFTRADGQFEFTGLKRGGTYRLIAAAPGFQDAVISRVHAVAITDLATADPIEMQLGQTVDRVVTVNDPASQPIASADVWLVPQDPKRPLDTHRFIRRHLQGRTNSNGQVNFSAVPFANGVLIVEKDRMGIEQVPWNGNDTTVTLSPPMTRKLVMPAVQQAINTIEIKISDDVKTRP